MQKINTKHQLNINVLVDHYNTYEFFNKLSELSDQTQSFLKPNINFRIYSEKVAKGIKAEIKPKQCIQLTNNYCVNYSDSNTDLDINLANITIAQICLLEKLPVQFYDVQNNVFKNCFENSIIKPDFDTCFEQQLLALSIEQ